MSINTIILSHNNNKKKGGMFLKTVSGTTCLLIAIGNLTISYILLKKDLFQTIRKYAFFIPSSLPSKVFCLLLLCATILRLDIFVLCLCSIRNCYLDEVIFVFLLCNIIFQRWPKTISKSLSKN